MVEREGRPSAGRDSSGPGGRDNETAVERGGPTEEGRGIASSPSGSSHSDGST